MANSDKNIRISTNKDTTALPKIVFTGQSNLPITLNVLDDNTLSFEGSSGQLFSINNVLSTGYIFSINDISGIPSFRVNADGTVGIAEFLGNVGIGLTNPAYKLQVSGSAGISGTANISGVLTLSSTIGSGSTTTGALVVSGGVGIGGSIFSSSAYASSLSGVVFNNGAITNTGTITSTGTMSISNSSTTAFSVRDGSNNPAFTIDTIGDIISLPVAIASTTTGTGSLVVAGGVGIGGSVNVGGRVGIGTNLLSGQLNIKTSSAATPGLVVQGAASQTADYAQFFTSTGTTSISITKDAEIKFPLAQDIKIYATPYASVGAIKTTGNFFALGGLIFAYGVSDSLSGSLSPTQLLISGLDWTTYSSGSSIRWATNNPVRIQPTGTSVVPLHINLNNASWTSGNSFEIANNGDLRFSIDYTGSTKIFSTVGSGSTTTGALVVTGGVGIGGSLNVNSASSISGVRIDSGILYGNLTGTATTAGFATTANYSNQSGYGLTSGFATTSSYSHQAGYAITSGSTGSATTSTYAHQSGYATTSGFATTATYSYQAGYGITAGLATTATYSIQSGYAITSGLATTSANVYVNSAGNANASHPILFTPSSSSSGSAVSSDATISFNPSTEILNVSGLAVTSGTASASTASGALIVTGGVGIGQSLFTSSSYSSSISGVVFNNGAITNTGTITSTGVMTLSNSSTTAFAVRDGSNNPTFTIDTIGDIVSLPVAIASTSTGTGSLVVAGGVGIGGTVNINGSLNSGSLASPVITLSYSGSFKGTLSTSTTYYYVVTALSYAGRESLPSNQVSVNTGSDTTGILQWSTVPGVKQYKVYRSTVSGVFTNSYITTAKAPGDSIFVDYGFPTSTGTPPSINQAFTNEISYNISNISLPGNTLHGLNIPSGRLSVNSTNDAPLTAVEISGDAAFIRPQLSQPSISNVGSGGTLAANTIYYYRASLVDMKGNESVASNIASVFFAASTFKCTIAPPSNNQEAQIVRFYRSTDVNVWTNTFIGETYPGFSLVDIGLPQSNSSPVLTSSSYGFSFISGSTEPSRLYSLSLGSDDFSGIKKINGVPVVAASASTAAGILTTNTTYYYKAVFFDNLGGSSRYGPEVAINTGSGSAIGLTVTIPYQTSLGQNQGAFVYRSTTPNFTTGARLFTTNGSVTDDGSVSSTSSINSSPSNSYQWFLGNPLSANLLPSNLVVAPSSSNGFGFGIAARSPSITNITDGSGAGTLTTGTTYYYRIVGLDSFGQSTSSLQIIKYNAPATGSIYLEFGSSRMGFSSYNVYRSTNPNSFTNTLIGNFRNNYFTDVGFATTSGSPRLSSNLARDIYLKGVNDNNIHTGFSVISNGFYTRTNVPVINSAYSVGPNSGTLTTNTNYYYKIRVNFWADNAYGEVSDPIKVSTGSSTAVYLQWTAIEGAQHYTLYRSTNPRNFTNATIINGIKDNYVYDFNHSVATETPTPNYNGSNTAIGDTFGSRLSSLLIIGDNQKLRSLFDAPKFSTYPSSTTGGTLATNTVFFYTVVARGYTGETSLASSEIRVDTGSNNAVNLNWLNVNGATGYDVYRSTTINSWSNTLIASNVQSTSFIDINYPATTGTPNRVNAYGVGYAESLFENNYNILGRSIFGSVNNVDSAYQNFTVRINGNIFTNTSASTLQVGTGFTNGYTFNGSSNGTELAIASGIGFTGSLLDAHSNGLSRFRINFDGSTSIGSTTSSISTSSGALTVSGGVGIGGSLYVSSATAISGVTINAGVITGSLTGTASTATYSHQSGYAITSGTSGLATTASYSIQSGYAITSGSSGSATTANNLNVVNATVNSTHTLLFSPTATGSGVAVSSNTTLSYNPSTNVLSTSGLAITSTTASTSTATGALQVAGGVGISGRLSFNQASFGTTGISINPTMAMIGNTGDPIFMSVLEDNTISFEGSQGQLFSITPNLSTGYIYSVNDITGIPLIRANANANVTANEYAGNFGIGITNPGYKLHVVGSVGFTSTTASTSTSTGTLVVSGGVGIGGSLYVASATAISGVTINNGVITGNLSGTATTATTATTAITLSVASAGSSNLAHSVLLTPNSSSGSAISSDVTITFNPSTEILSVSGLAVTSTTGSSTTTTGALIVSGGVGIGGSFNVGNKSRFNDEVYINSLSNNALYSSGSGGVAYNWAVGGNLSSNKYFLGLDLGLHPVGGNQSVVQTFWGMQLVGNSGVVPASFTPTSYGSAGAIGVLVPNQQSNRVAFGIIANASQTADLQIWTSSTASTSSPYLAVKADGQIYSYITTPSTSYNTGALVVSGGVGIGGSLFVNGDLTINGTTTTINSVTISVDDKNIELGSVASPSDVTAEGGGITLKGSTDKFINWYSGVGWSSSESWNLVVGSTYKINGTNVLTSTALGTGVTNSSLTSVGTITSGTWAGTTITAHYGGTGLTTPFTVGDLLYANSSTTWARLPANSNSGYVLTSAGSGSTPVYASASSITTGSATTAFNVNVVLAASNANHSLLFSPSLGTASGAAVSNDSTLVFNPSTEILTVSGLAITSSAATTSSSSGALIVSGGVGIGGSVIVGGRVGIGTVPNLSMLNIQTASAGTTGLSISASASQSANLFEWYADGGVGGGYSQAGRIRPSGNFVLGASGNITMSTGASAILALQGRGSTEGLAIRGFNSGAFEPLFEIQGNPGNQLFGIYGDGGVNAPRINVTNSTGSTSTSSGALIVTGGVGIGGSLNVSSASSISGVTFNSGVITGTLSGYATTSNNLRISSAGSSNLSHSVLFSPNSSTSGSAVSSDSTFTFNSSTEILSVSGLAITNTTSSTSTTTGALTVAGGVGIAGTVNILGDETVNGRLYYSQSTVGTAASSVIPSIMFVGQNNNPITLSVLADNTLSFEGSSGQLFSINNNLSSGTIFSVNDISGIPIIRANANGTLSMGEFTGTVGVGLTNPSFKFQVSGSAGFSGTVYVTGNSAFASTTASTSTSTGALTVSGGVGIGGSLNVNSASLISSVILSSGTVIGNLTGIATTASYAYQSGYGLTSGLATTATYALQSGYAITSGSSSFATTAGFATTSTYSLQSGYGITAGLATTATYALQSGYAITSGSSSFATTSGFATTASYSYQSGYGITAGFATSATSASVANTSYSVNVNAASANSSHYLIFSPSATGSGVALSTETALVYNPSTDILSTSGLAVTSSLGSTSTSNGALLVTGGVGIGGSLYSGSVLTAGRLQNQSFSGSSLGSTDGRSANTGALIGHDKISYGNGLFVTNSSWGAYNAAYSTDGTSWTASSLPVNQGYPVNFYGNGYFVLAASGATNVLYSANGTSWSQVSIGNTFNRTDGAYGNGKYVIVGTGQTYNYSSNLTTWTSGTLPLTGNWRIAYGNGVFVALGYGTRQIIYSYDGIYWNLANTKVDYALNWTGLKYANGRFIASSYSGGGSAYSLDGINWYSAVGTGGENLEKISYGNGVYFVSSTGNYYTSGDGTTYNNATPWSVAYQAGNTEYGLGKFQALGRFIDGPTNTVTIEPKFTGEINNVRIGAITPGSGDFTNLSSTGSANLVGTVNAYDLNIVSKLNQTPVLGGFAGTTGWTSAGLLSGAANYGLAFGNGLFVSIRKTTNSTSFSPDGRQWVTSAMPFIGNWMSIAWGVDKFVAVASAGTTGAYSGNGISWTSMSMPSTAQGWYAVTYGDDKFVAVGNTSTAAYSSDGISWTGSSIANTNWTGVAYGNGTFVAVSGFGLSGAYSYDGINWNLINLPTNGGTGIKFITYGNGYFIVTNYVNNDINYSRDGINWATTVRTSTYGIKTDIAYGNGIYSIFNYQEGTYSYDGVNWLLGNTIAATDWQAVAYGNNRFVATSINTGQVGSIDGPSNTLNLHPKFTGDIDNVRIGAKQPGAAEFTNLAAQQPVRFTANTTSLNTNTGALVVVGGVGIGGSLYTSSSNTSSISGLNILNGSLSSSTGTIAATNKLRISASDTSAFVVADGSNSAKLTVDTIGGIVTVSSSTASTSTTTGALVVTGGVGIGNTLYVAGRVDASNYKAWVENRTLSSVDTCVGIGTFFIDNGAHNILISLNVSDGGYSVAKNYTLTSNWNIGGWSIVAPLCSTGAYGNNQAINFQLEAYQGSGSLTLRARSLGTGGNLKIYAQNVGQNTATFTAYNSATSETAISSYHPYAFASQENNVFKINSSIASTSTGTGALIVTGGVGIGGSLYVNSASSISGVILSSGTVIGNLTGLATTSTYSHQSGYAITSGSSATATTATYSHQSGYGLTSGFATTATYSYQSGYGLTSGLATTATYSHQSGYAITSGSASSSSSASIANTSYNVYVNAASANSSHYLIFSPTATGSGVALSSESALVYNPSSDILSVSGLAVTSGTASTSATTGALVVTGGVGIGLTLTVGLGISTPVISAPNNLLLKPGVDSTTGIQFTRSSAAIPVLTIDTLNSRVGIGLTNPEFDFEVNGSISATTKSFVIEHPTKKGMKLRYGSLEGPENGVYVRGELKDNNIIVLPDYWSELVDQSTITVHLTPIGNKFVYVKEIKKDRIIVGARLFQKVHCFYSVWAERKDVPKLKVEI